MRRGSLVSWLCLCLWASWIVALQGWSVPALGRWTPDLALVLVFALLPRLSPEAGRGVLVAVVAARAALSLDPPAALLAGYGGAAGAYAALRSTVQLGGAPERALLTGFSAFAIAAWLAGVHWLHHPVLAELPEAAHVAPLSFWRTGLASGAAALFLAPLLARLPGLRGLERER